MQATASSKDGTGQLPITLVLAKRMRAGVFSAMRRTSSRLPVIFAIASAMAFALIAASCARSIEARTEYVIGTLCRIDLQDQGSDSAYREIFARLRSIEDAMSANKDGTELDAVNRAAGIAPVAVGADMMAVAVNAVRYAELSGGAFDPTVGPLVKLWNIGSPDARIPAPEEIAAALKLIDWRELVVDEKAGTLFLKKPGMRLDFGAIAKGYAADAVAEILARRRIRRAVVDLGGNVLVYGKKKDGSPWRVGVQDPSGLRGSHIGIVRIEAKTLVTSGVYERFLEEGGRRYHHILSTRDGYPVSNGLISVTIVADKSVDADALSTSAFALGWEKGKALVETIPGAEAIFVWDDLSVRATPGIKKDFTLSDERYRIVD